MVSQSVSWIKKKKKHLFIILNKNRIFANSFIILIMYSFCKATEKLQCF